MNGNSHQYGVGLIEILISLLVIAIGLLGLAALHGKAQQAEMESYQRTQALMLLQDMTARLRANRAGAVAGLYSNKTVGYSSGFTDTSSCTGNASQSAVDLSCWHNALLGAGERLNSGGSSVNVGALIGGHGCITDQNDVFTVTVAWQGLSESKLSTSDPRNDNACGEGLYGDSDALRRIMSVPVFFYDENSEL